MWKRIAIGGGIAAAVLGAGGIALADSASAAAITHDRLRHAEQAQWVTHSKKTNSDVTHDAIRGQVSAVSASSITVQAANGASETFAVVDSTTVRAKGDSKAHPGSIGEVKTGDRAIVIGTGSGALTASHIVDRGN